MPLQETFNLNAEAKVIPGVTTLRDPLTGVVLDIQGVISGRMPTEDWPFFRGSSATGQCALHGGRMHWKKDDA